MPLWMKKNKMPRTAKMLKNIVAMIFFNLMYADLIKSTAGKRSCLIQNFSTFLEVY